MHRARYRRILLFFSRALASVVIWDLILPRLGLGGWSRRTRPRRLGRISRGYRRLAIRLGGVHIKVGQFLSTRVDVLPEEITVELAGLQDEVPPEDYAAIKTLAEAELGCQLEERFEGFSPEPLAAASLGQVHRARLKASANGGAGEQAGSGQRFRDVVVKIQRPGIEEIIATDLAALRTVAGWLQRYPPIRRRADVPALLEEFTRVIYEEIDYLQEGRNAEVFGDNFAGRRGYRVPEVIWEHTTRRVLTLEDVYAIKITDYEGVTGAGIDRELVAKRLFDAYMQQIFVDGFVHADPHPGNLFVQPEDGGGEEGRTWRLTFVDFGMVARVTPEIRAGLRELAIALGTQDSARLIQSYQILGVLLPTANLELLERIEARAFERFWGKTMTELRDLSYQELREFGSEFREVLFDMPFQVPQDMIFLGRTVAILSGMCTGLDPHFNFWESLAPYARQYLAEEAGSNWEVWLEALLELLRSAFAVPGRLDKVLGQMERGELAVRVPELDRRVRSLELGVRRLVGAVVFAALLLSGAQFLLAGWNVAGGVLLAGAVLALAWVIAAR
jgi:predicted unusual protein kinase regulating ubiquinone biosynthesis (AarF/ABC1/UbiB family)